MAEKEEEELNIILDANNMTMDTFFQSLTMTNSQEDIANVTIERYISLDITAETIKGFNGLALQSTINDFTYYNSEEDDAESYPNSDPKVATHISDGKKGKVADTDTTNRNYQQKLLINQLIPEIISVVIPPTDPWIMYGVAASSGTLHARQMISLKEIVTDAVRSGARVFNDPTAVNWKDMDRMISQCRNTIRMVERLTNPVLVGDGPSVSTTRMGSQEIGSPSGSIGPQEVRDAQPLDTSINRISVKHRYPAPTFNHAIGCKFSEESIVDVYWRC